MSLLSFSRNTYWLTPTGNSFSSGRYVRRKWQLLNTRFTMGGDTYLDQNLSLFGKIQMWYWKLVAGRYARHLLSDVFGIKITELFTNEHPSGSARNLIILETFSSLSF